MDDERFTRFLDAQEHPEKYTEEELYDIMQDGEGLAELKRALMKEKASKAEIDVDAEWDKFCKEHGSHDNLEYGSRAVTDGHKSHTLQWYKIAAMFIGFILLAGIAYAAMVNFGFVSKPFNEDEVVAKGSIAAPTFTKQVENKATTDSAKQTKTTEPKTKVFDNETLANILDEMGKYYGVSVVFANESSKSIRLYFEWNQTKSLDENIKVLNSFQQITITHKGSVVTVN